MGIPRNQSASKTTDKMASWISVILMALAGLVIFSSSQGTEAGAVAGGEATAVEAELGLLARSIRSAEPNQKNKIKNNKRKKSSGGTRKNKNKGHRTKANSRSKKDKSSARKKKVKARK